MLVVVCVPKRNVLTVPMRNGNHWLGRQDLRQLFRSYRTYEEWKRWIVTVNVNNLCVLVLTVPMRNGNTGNGKFRARVF